VFQGGTLQRTCNDVQTTASIYQGLQLLPSITWPHYHNMTISFTVSRLGAICLSIYELLYWYTMQFRSFSDGVNRQAFEELQWLLQEIDGRHNIRRLCMQKAGVWVEISVSLSNSNCLDRLWLSSGLLFICPRDMLESGIVAR